MPKQCLIVRRRDSLGTLSCLVEQCGLLAQEVDGERLDERGISAILAAEPYAVVLPLSLPRYASMRIAELIALRRARIRLILVSGTRAPTAVLNEMFDRHLPQCGDGLIDALQQPSWTHAFERRGSTIDEAIQCILRTAACFWLSGGGHPEAFATVVDYHRAVAVASRHLTLLFLASDPADGARLRLVKELAVIEEELTKRSEYTFSCKYMFSSRPDELARRLLEEKPHVVHFSGHGDASGRLCFENANGGSWPADKAAIAQIFEPLRRYTKCVVLNACFSAKQARLIGKHIEYTVGFKSSVSDDAAVAMARGFYGTLSATGRVSSAVDAARSNLRLMSKGGTETLYCAHKVPDFGAYTHRGGDSCDPDPALCARLREMNHLMAGDIRLPIPMGAKCVTEGCPRFAADMNGMVSVRFSIRDSLAALLTFYNRWAQQAGWFVELVLDHGEVARLHLARGMERMQLRFVQGEHETFLVVVLEQAQVVTLAA